MALLTEMRAAIQAASPGAEVLFAHGVDHDGDACVRVTINHCTRDTARVGDLDLQLSLLGGGLFVYPSHTFPPAP